MDGGKIEPVDIITFGSPCQDMSIAGRREGLDGSRSSLFYEAVRIAKEMRCKLMADIQGISSGRTSPARSVPTRARTSSPSSKRSARSRDTKFILLDLRGGRPPERSWQMISVSHGGYLMRSTGEYPNAENVSTLSQILQAGVPEKYYLRERQVWVCLNDQVETVCGKDGR